MIHFDCLRNRARLRRRIPIDEVELTSISRVRQHSSKERDGWKKRSICLRGHHITCHARNEARATELESVHELGKAHLNSACFVEAEPAHTTIGHNVSVSAIEVIVEPSEAAGSH